jgi:outer membrane protein OmpA-like peptidoglycan-associated protein
MRLYLLIFSLLWAVSLEAQVKCINDPDGNCIAKGKVKKIKVKTSYGSGYTVEIREGKWELFSPDGVKIAEGNYSVKDQASYKHGDWNYYSEDNVLLFTRTYEMGAVVKTKFLDSGTYSGEGEIIIVVTDSMGYVKVKEKKGQLELNYEGVLNTDLSGDPIQLSADFLKNRKVSFLTSRDSDSVFLSRYPNTRASLNITPWPVIATGNLISNGNFEAGSDFVNEGNASQIQKNNDAFAVAWGSSNETPDFYKINGNCYAGFRVMGVNFEVLRNKLKHPLEEGKTYCLQFKIKLKPENHFAFNGISVSVNKDLLFFKNSEEGRRAGIVLQSHNEMVLGCREQWMTISGYFEAEGGEQYLYISNFTDEKELKIFKTDSLSPDYVDEIYYLIDDVVLTEVESASNCPCNVKACELNFELPVDTTKKTNIFVRPAVGQKIILRNIQFETAKWTLLPESFEQLDSLVDLLLKYPNMKVEISGYTDNKGKPKENITLSQNRAEAVVKYLIEAGVDPEQLLAKGYGQEEPIDTNDNEKGRANNRRVEFKIIEL